MFVQQFYRWCFSYRPLFIAGVVVTADKLIACCHGIDENPRQYVNAGVKQHRRYLIFGVVFTGEQR
jgi:hypothetical protein